MNQNQSILQIPIEDIIPNRFQPRLAFDEKALTELANSIKQHGIIQPLVVRKLGEKYEIIAGERRYKAATMAGLNSVPVIISEIDDATSAEVALVENVQRKDLTAIEEARSYKNILDKGTQTQETLAKKMGLSQSAIANKLRLLNLSAEVQDALLKEKISERHARSLLVVEDKEEQNSWLNRILTERLTVRQLDDLLKAENKTDSLEDVPLVNINQDIEEIKMNATDIVNNNMPTEKPLEKKEEFKPMPNKFFNFLEDEAANMDTANTPQSGSIFSPISNESEESTDTDIENLDDSLTAANVSLDQELKEKMIALAPGLEESEIEMLSDDPQTPALANDLGDTINKIRNKINELNQANKINIEELDLPNSYQINITINKE